MINEFKNIKVGGLVRVNDVDLLIELSDNPATKNLQPDFLVKEKNEYKENLSHYIVLLLDHIGSDFECLLVCSIYQEAFDIKLYTRPDFFKPDQRIVIEKSELNWLFDGDSYPQEIYDGTNTFKKKFQNEMFGNTCLVEWETDAKIVNYQLLVIETGSTNQYGGWVEFYEGRMISDKDVSI